jgi:septum site-determining protein MinC
MDQVSAKNQTPLACQLKGSVFTLPVLILHSTDLKAVNDQLKTAIQEAPKFFDNAPLIIDLNELFANSATDDRINLDQLTTTLRTFHLLPLGIRGGDDFYQQAALALGLGIMNNTKTKSEDSYGYRIKQLQKRTQEGHKENTSSPSSSSPTTNKPSEAPSSASLPLTTTKIVTEPVRSGQQIYARGADLVILTSVSHGAEVLADGNIHIYGDLNGRALAGVQGNTDAHIFCKTLNAELIAVAGHYKVREDITCTEESGFIDIYLENNLLKMRVL